MKTKHTPAYVKKWIKTTFSIIHSACCYLHITRSDSDLAKLKRCDYLSDSFRVKRNFEEYDVFDILNILEAQKDVMNLIVDSMEYYNEPREFPLWRDDRTITYKSMKQRIESCKKLKRQALL